MVDLFHRNIASLMVEIEYPGLQEFPEMIKRRGIAPNRLFRSISFNPEMLDKLLDQLFHPQNFQKRKGFNITNPWNLSTKKWSVRLCCGPGVWVERAGSIGRVSASQR